MRALLLALGVAALAGCGDDGIAALDGGVTDAALDAPVDAAPPSWPFALPANFRVYWGLGAAVASGWVCTAIGGKY